MKTQEITDAEIIHVDAEAGEITVPGTEKDLHVIKQSKIKAYQVLKPTDFVKIGDNWEAKKDAMLKILSSLPISYEWRIKEREVIPGSHAVIVGELHVTVGEVVRKAEGLGTVEANEFTGKLKYSLHNMTAKAETRAMKRAIDMLFGSVINFYVMNYLERAA